LRSIRAVAAAAAAAAAAVAAGSESIVASYSRFSIALIPSRKIRDMSQPAGSRNVSNLSVVSLALPRSHVRPDPIELTQTGAFKASRREDSIMDWVLI